VGGRWRRSPSRCFPRQKPRPPLSPRWPRRREPPCPAEDLLAGRRRLDHRGRSWHSGLEIGGAAGGVCRASTHEFGIEEFGEPTEQEVVSGRFRTAIFASMPADLDELCAGDSIPCTSDEIESEIQTLALEVRMPKVVFPLLSTFRSTAAAAQSPGFRRGVERLRRQPTQVTAPECDVPVQRHKCGSSGTSALPGIRGAGTKKIRMLPPLATD
jgi:hypothetical protein